MMLKKILTIAAKILLGLFVFYLFAGFLVLPLGLRWAIKNQGTKFLRHPVSARSVWFNPFLYRLDINGFEILDEKKRIMAGFDRLVVDVSFLSVLKKIYRVESFQLDGLNVNAALLTDGRINLMDLVPKETPPQSAVPPASPEVKPAVAQPDPAQPLPLVIVDDLTLSRGRVVFLDQTITPNFTVVLSDIQIKVTGFSTKEDSQTRVNFQAKLDNQGVIALEAQVNPFIQPLQLETSFTLNSYALSVLTPYVGKYTGRSVGDGKLDLKMDYRIAQNQLIASHKLLIQRFEFGDKVESKDALPLPFGLAVALLEDPQGRINIALPVKGDMSDPEFEYWHLVGQVARNFFLGLVTKPFKFLASTLGSEDGTEELGYVRFLPGQTGLSEEEQSKVKTLVKGLKERPRLYLEINGSYDPGLDWDAIKREIFAKDYHHLRNESVREESKVLQHLYQRRFGLRALWRFMDASKGKDGMVDEVKLNEELKRQLIESSRADKAALDILAQTRAQAVFDLMIAEGFDQGRIRIGGNRQTQASMGQVPMEFTLTVFEDSLPAAGEPGAVDGQKN